MPKIQLQPSTSTLQVEDQHIELVQKRIKRINLTVHYLTGKVRVSAPLSVGLVTIREFVYANLNWIKRQQQKVQLKAYESAQKFVDGEMHYFNGEKYQLNVIEKDAKPRVDLHADSLTLYARIDSTPEKRSSILDDWYRQQLNIKIPIFINKYEPLMNVKVAEFAVKKMKSRWGTCNTRARRIWLSLELAKKAEICLEYVVVHEMVHLLEPSHNHRFKSLMDTFMPDWKLIKKQLNNHGYTHEKAS